MGWSILEVTRGSMRFAADRERSLKVVSENRRSPCTSHLLPPTPPGVGAYNRTSVRRTRRRIMNEFVFLYRGGQRPSPSELGEQVLQRWAAWLKELADNGHLVDR